MRHPWLTTIVPNRSILGPNRLKKHDWELRAVEAPYVDIQAAVSALTAYVHGSARRWIESSVPPAHSMPTSAEWWLVHQPFLELILDEGRYPAAARALKANRQESRQPMIDFEYGLARMLDGIEQRAKIAARVARVSGAMDRASHVNAKVPKGRPRASSKSN
jgi:hypothetical protein